ncbi:uncharacterized protein LOC117300105 [Asterias rubens]|uniref:uncharacterized protein LOC117300105 n=1 Tax=Asterias rubens TaxID=7604 RepID=UPI0014555BD3|nr:uncharacterized protein LOC117300105 [Asterias rubens]
MAAILVKMSSLLSTNAHHLSTILVFFALFTLSDSSPGTVANSPHHVVVEPGFLFVKLLQQYSKIKTQLISCSLAASLGGGDDAVSHINGPPLSSSTAGGSSRCLTGSGVSLDTDSLIDVRVSGDIADKCKHGGNNLLRCLSNDAFVNKILGNFMGGLRPGILRMCCILDGCGFGVDVGGDREDNACLSCLSGADGIMFTRKNKTPDQSSFLQSLSRMLCTDLKFNNMPCTKLNLVALNLLSGPADQTILEGAADVIRQCNPSFSTESIRLFQMIIGNLSHNDTLRIKALLAPHGSEVKQPHPVKYISGDNSVKKERMSDLTARAKTGLVVMGILVAISLFLGAWVIYQRAKAYYHPNEAVRYSQININDIYIDDQNRDDDEYEDDGDPGEGVPTPYRS